MGVNALHTAVLHLLWPSHSWSLAQNFHRKHIHHLAAQNMAESQFAYFYQVQKFILHWRWHTIERFHSYGMNNIEEPSQTLDSVLLWCFTVTNLKGRPDWQRFAEIFIFHESEMFSHMSDGDRWRSMLSSLETWQPLVLSVWTGPEIFS